MLIGFANSAAVTSKAAHDLSTMFVLCVRCSSHLSTLALRLYASSLLMMSLSSFPTVLAQSVAHFLPTQDRIVLARCSRRARKCAAAAFAWLSADPVSVDVGRHLPSGPLLSFIPVSVVWVEPFTAHSSAGRVAAILSMANRSAISALHIELRQKLSDALASQLLQDPTLQRLQSITLGMYKRRLLELACQLPLLATLRLLTPITPEDAAMLSAAPSLTDLTVSHADSSHSCFSFVFQSSKVRRLTVLNFQPAVILSMSQELAWQRLRELSLTSDDERIYVLSSDAVTAGFPFLRSLMVLRLAGKNWASESIWDPLLAHAHRIPTLRRLIIECVNGGGSLHCSDDVVLSLPLSAPQLCVEWLVSEDSFHRVESSLRPLLAPVCGRLMIREELNAKQSMCIVRDAAPCYDSQRAAMHISAAPQLCRFHCGQACAAADIDALQAAITIPCARFDCFRWLLQTPDQRWVS